MLSGCDWWISIRSKKTVVNASLKSFVYKALKDEQIECIHRIVCHGRDVLAVLPTGLGKSATYQLISKVLFRMGRTANARGGTPLYGLYRYVPRNRVWFLEVLLNRVSFSAMLA